MARGDMKIDVMSVSTDVEILNRKENQAVAMTIDFTDVDDTADNGLKYVKGGTPIDKDGKPVKTTPWANAVGILWHDTYEDRPQTALLKEAYIHTKRAQDNSGCTYDAALVAALVNAGCRIVFEEPMVLGTIPGATSAGGGGY